VLRSRGIEALSILSITDDPEDHRTRVIIQAQGGGRLAVELNPSGQAASVWLPTP
jgi:hypothetical protein